MAEVVIGGTFNGLHRGHMELIEKAFSLGCPVIIGLTSDAMAKGKDVPGKIAPYAERKRKLAEFLSFNGWLSRTEIFKIEDPFSGGLRPGLTHIVVSPGTRGNAEKINAMRRKKGLSPLRIVEVPWMLAKDGKPISGTRMRQGKIGSDGSLVRRVQKRKLPG